MLNFLAASALALSPPALATATTPLCYQQLTRFLQPPTVCQTRQKPPPFGPIVIIDNNFCYFLCQPSSVDVVGSVIKN